MASVERIERDLAELSKTVTGLAQEFYDRYTEYLQALGQTVRQQVILACFQMCTQGYPQQFLALSLGQRQTLQRSLRELAKDTQSNLAAILYFPGTEEEIALALEQQPIDDAEQSSDAPVATDLPIAVTEPERSPEPPNPEQDAAAFPEPGDRSPSPPPEPRSLTPTDLATWQENVELSILKELQLASHQANRLLQQAGILPTQLAETLFQQMGQPEMAEVVGNTPNLLNLLIAASEEDSDDEPESRERAAAVLQILAIQLRLPEIEFAEAALTTCRNRLRSLSVQLKKLSQLHYKKRQELAIAQAQDAWRASWYED